MDAISYIRISTKDQSTYSLEYQERNVRTYCQQNNLNLIALFKDDGESSYSFDRPDWKALERFIKKNKSVEYLIIPDHDRLSRNLAEALIKIRELKEKFGIKVLATTDSLDTDFSDPSTFMLRAFKFMMAEGELHGIRKRTREGYVQASLKGLYVNRAPYGYINTRDERSQPTLKVDDEKAVIVGLLFKEYNRGTTIEELRKVVEPYGYTQKGNSAIQRILTNPVYAGMVRVPAHGKKTEQIIRGLHPPIISESEYWRAQNRMTGNKRIGMHSNEEVPLKGVLVGPQGRLMSAGNSKGKKGVYYWYYVQQEDHKHFSAIKLHQQLNEILDLLSFDQQRLDWIYEKLSDEIARFLYQRAELLSKSAKALRQVQDKIGQTEERYLLQEGSINKKTFDKVIASLRKQEVELQHRLNDLNADQNVYWQKLNALLPKLHDMRGTYLEMDLYRRQQFLNMVFDNSLTHDGTTYRTPTLHPMFAHNELILKEKGLLVVEQPSVNSDNNPVGTPSGSGIEHLIYLSNLLTV